MDDNVRLVYSDLSFSPPTEGTAFSDSLSSGASTEEHAVEGSSVTRSDLHTESNTGSRCSSPSSQNLSHPKTLEEFWNCGQRGEWAFGRFVPMPPPSKQHEDRVFFVWFSFWTILKRSETKLNCALEPKVSLVRDGEVHHRYPDIVFYFENESEPEICFEVVSKDDRARDVDLVDKVLEYASLGIPVFVLVDAEVKNPGENQGVIVYSEPHPEEREYKKMEMFVEGEKVIGHEALMQLDHSAVDFLRPSVTREAHGESLQLRKQWEEEQVEKLDREKQRANEAMAKAEKAELEKKEAVEKAKKAELEKKEAVEKAKKAEFEKKEAVEKATKAEVEKEEAMSEIEQLRYTIIMEREKSKKLETELKRKRSDYEG